MRRPLDVFCEIPCLTEKSSLLNGVALQKKWFKSADKRYIGQYLQKFIDYNSHHFNFLGITPKLTGTDQSISLIFRTTSYIGTIPLRSSDNGKQIGDLVVTPRFTGQDKFEDYIEIINLLGSDISPQIIDSLPLISGRNFRPPLYLEAIKFITTLEKLIRTPWRKFDNTEKFTNQPTGTINWKKYTNTEYKVEKRLIFPTNKNILSELHQEYSKIKYVFGICKNELLSSNTPQRIKNQSRNRLSIIEEKLYTHTPVAINSIPIRSADSPIVINCKKQANKILERNFINSTAWRVDYSEVFEKFVQYIFKETAKETGGKIYTNLKFHSSSQIRYSWELKHVEPDAIYQKKQTSIFIDAKYKSNLYNKFSNSENLKEDHRHDLHQILAYSSFNQSNLKYGFLCYPSEKLEIKETSFSNRINNTKNTILVFGIPLKAEIILQAKQILTEKLYGIEKRESPL